MILGSWVPVLGLGHSPNIIAYAPSNPEAEDFDKDRIPRYTLSGYLRGQSGENLVGATIQVLAQGAGTVSNAYGFYSLMLDSGEHTLLVQYLGYQKLTKTIPKTNEINDAEINQAIAFPPTLPTIFMSPILAIPTTKVEKTKGAIIICTKRINMVPNNFMFFDLD